MLSPLLSLGHLCGGATIICQTLLAFRELERKCMSYVKEEMAPGNYQCNGIVTKLAREPLVFLSSQAGLYLGPFCPNVEGCSHAWVVRG